MDKKDIYEHLAKIYLDASYRSSKKSKKSKVAFLVSRNVIIAAAVLAVGVSVWLSYSYTHRSHKNAEVALVLSSDALKVNFNFDPAKKEIYSLNLNHLNLASYKMLGFSLKKNNFQDTISLRVEFTNAFKERSELYVRDIPHKWQDYKVKLSDFTNIKDWSEITSLAFIVEEWNAFTKQGVVYIDNVRLLK